MNCCNKCGKETQSRYFVNGLCGTCRPKGKPKTVTNVPVSNHLNANALA
jgi:hypothetical protein